MQETNNSIYGQVLIGTKEELFRKAHELIEIEGENASSFSVGLTGGSTPIAFYKWVREGNSFSSQVVEKAIWSVSDERMVPIEDDDSNFGNADRGMLQDLKVSETNKLPWPVQVDPHSAALIFATKWEERFGQRKAFDLCFLGMGDDGHTASIFPRSPLLHLDSNDIFTSVKVPEKGWRLTITPHGFSFCKQIIIMITGKNKASVLKEILEGEADRYPVQLLRHHSARVLWLVDEAAASELGENF